MRYASLIADNYYNVRDKVYENWNDSLLRSWLESHGITKTSAQAKRDELLKVVKENYYGAHDKIWDTWSNAEMKAYLVKEKLAEESGLANLRRNELENMLEEKYSTAKENVVAGWDESHMRQWLTENGVIKPDYQAKKDEIFDLFSEKYSQAASKARDYIGWSDNRLRGWLRLHGVNVSMSTPREELLQLMQENYTESKGKIHKIFSKVTNAIFPSEQALEETIKRLKEAVGAGGAKEDAASYYDKIYEEATKVSDGAKHEL